MKRLLEHKIVSLCLLTLLLFVGCEGRSTLTGRIVDAETNEPIEGAVIVINWYKYAWYNQVLGLGKGKTILGVYEAVSDSKGNFDIFKHSFAKYHMAVYKKGYICWSSDYIFNPRGEKGNNLWIKIEKHKLFNDMTIKLLPFKNDNLKNEHAEFIYGVRSRCESKQLFNTETRDEIIRYRKNMREIRKQKSFQN